MVDIWTPDQQRTAYALRSIRGTPKNPTLLRVPDAVQRSSRCTAEPGHEAMGRACLNSAIE